MVGCNGSVGVVGWWVVGWQVTCGVAAGTNGAWIPVEVGENALLKSSNLPQAPSIGVAAGRGEAATGSANGGAAVAAGDCGLIVEADCSALSSAGANWLLDPTGDGMRPAVRK